MQIGRATLRPVVEIDEIQMTAKAFIDDITPADIAKHADWLAPQYYDLESGACRLSQHAWLLDVGGKRILIDPCVGHRRHRPVLPFYHMIDSPLIDRLCALDAPPETVDYVFCTHFHLDHVGWNTRLSDGRYVPTFPNARYLFPHAENEYWRRDPPGEAVNEGVYAECIKPVIEAGLADFVDEGVRIADSVTLIEAAGHTAGHMAGVLETLGEGAVFAGDAIHHPLQIVFPDRPVHGYDPELGWATRRKLLDICVERDFWLAPAHFRAPHVCKVRRDGPQYRVEWPED